MMTDTIAKIGEFLSQQEQTATAVAQRFGMHLHDDVSVSFTPRDHRFAHGEANRMSKSKVLNDVTLEVAPHNTLTVGQMRAAFGPFTRIEAEHLTDSPRWIARFSPPGQPHHCQIVFNLVTGYVKGEPADDLPIRSVELIPEP